MPLNGLINFYVGVISAVINLHILIFSTLLDVQRKTEDERKEYAKECENMRRCATPRYTTRKNAQFVTNLQQTYTNAVSTTCQQDVFALLVPKLSTPCLQLATRLLSSTDSLQLVPTTCHRPAIQQLIKLL
jgi:hypothetical protein